MYLETPEISSDPGVKMDPIEVQEEYRSFLRSSAHFLEGNIGFRPVDLIVLGNGRWSTKRALGHYQSTKNGRQITIYPELIEESQIYGGWREILSHEAGHAVQEDIVQEDILDSAAEAFADLVAFVHLFRSNEPGLNSFLGLHLAANPRLLFGGSQDLYGYPRDFQRKADTALLNFIAQEMGIKKMLLVSSLPVLAREQAILIKLHIAQGHYIDLQKGKTVATLEEEIQNTIGVSREELLIEANKWYGISKYGFN